MSKKIIRKTDGFETALDFKKVIAKLDLKGKDVLVYSRLFSFGRLMGVESVSEIISILKSAIGDSGVLIIPTYTLSTYKNPKVFNEKESKVMSGVLGEYSLKDKEFVRSIHPIYSNSIYNDNQGYYLNQNKTTCFGKNSFFDLFSRKKNGVVLMLGLNFNGPSLYHYYDQKFKAPGRLIKTFNVLMSDTNGEYEMNFDSFVKDYNFYKNKKNCLGRFDAIANKLRILKTVFFGDGYIHKISEPDFQNLYKITLNLDQNYFLMSSTNDWVEYYTKNNYKYFYGTLSQEKISEIKELWIQDKKT